MTPDKLRFYHAQAAKLDLRRKWQWMATWPLVYQYGNIVEMVFEYPCLHYRIDLYIPALKLAVEIDEPHHEWQPMADGERQKLIESQLGCRFIRLKVTGSERSLYKQIEDLLQDLAPIINGMDPWQLPTRRVRVARAMSETYSDANRIKLEQGGVPDLVESMIADLAALHIDTTEELGPLNPSNGELGFTVIFSGIRFVVSVRANGSVKTLVTQHDPGTPERLGITLDGPKHGACDYWTIKEMRRGALSIDQTLSAMARFNDLLA